MITILGGVNNHGGNAILAHTPNHAYVLDYGYTPYNAPNTTPNYEILHKYVDGPWELEFIHVSHAHLDHFGAIPFLIDKTYNNNIYTSTSTAILLHFIFQTPFLFGIPKILRTYLNTLQTQLISLLTPLINNHWIKINNESYLIQIPNNHAPGSVSVFIKNKSNMNIYYTGDIGPNFHELIPLHVKRELLSQPFLFIFDATTLFKQQDSNNNMSYLIDLIYLYQAQGKPVLIFTNPLGHAQYLLTQIIQQDLVHGRQSMIYLYGRIHDLTGLITQPLVEVDMSSQVVRIKKLERQEVTKQASIILASSFQHESSLHLQTLKKQVLKAGGAIIHTVPSHGIKLHSLKTILDFLSLKKAQHTIPHYESSMSLTTHDLPAWTWYFPISMHASQQEIYDFIRRFQPTYAIPIQYSMSTWKQYRVQQNWSTLFPTTNLEFLMIGEELIP